MQQTLLHCLNIFFWDCSLRYEPFESSYEFIGCLILHEFQINFSDQNTRKQQYI